MFRLPAFVSLGFKVTPKPILGSRHGALALGEPNLQKRSLQLWDVAWKLQSLLSVSGKTSVAGSSVAPPQKKTSSTRAGFSQFSDASRLRRPPLRAHFPSCEYACTHIYKVVSQKRGPQLKVNRLRSSPSRDLKVCSSALPSVATAKEQTSYGDVVWNNL